MADASAADAPTTAAWSASPRKRTALPSTERMREELRRTTPWRRSISARVVQYGEVFARESTDLALDPYWLRTSLEAP